MGVMHSGPMTGRKLLAKVSCGIVTQWSHDGQETVCEGFPAGMSHIGPLPDRKLPAKGFLLACHALVLCRTGNCLQKVSYWHVTQQPHDGQETFTHKKRTPMKGVLLEWQKIILQS